MLLMAEQLGAKVFGEGWRVEVKVAERKVHVMCAVEMAVGFRDGHMMRACL